MVAALPNSTKSDQLKKLAAYWFQRSGWAFTGTLPKRVPQSIIVAGPHTRSRDFWIALAVSKLARFRTRILVRQHWLRFPSGPLVKKLGGIPAPRAMDDAAMDHIRREFRDRRLCSFVFTAKRSGRKGEGWEEFFYDLSCELRIPIVMVGIDNRRKRVKFHTHFYPGIDRERDLAFIRRFFESFVES